MFRTKPWQRWLATYAATFGSACAQDDAELEPDSSAIDATLPFASGADAGLGSASPPGTDASLSQEVSDAEPLAEAGLARPSDGSVVAEAGMTSDGGSASSCAVEAIPAALRTSYRMGAIYKRYASADGIPVIASEKPSDEAVHRACLLVLDYASVRRDVREVLLSKKVRFIMMAKSEKTVDFPEYAAYGDLDWRARGLGGVTDAICAEESILCDRESDRWRGESICVHEYAHTLHNGAWNLAIPDFDARVVAAYRAATAAGKYANTYAGEQPAEYLAEGVQDWYNTNLQSATPNGVHNHVNTRAELKEYDPTLYALLQEVLPERPTFRDCYYYE